MPAAQAVGGAVGSNPLSIIVPCHRVVGKTGSLTGFGGTINNDKNQVVRVGELICQSFMYQNIARSRNV